MKWQKWLKDLDTATAIARGRRYTMQNDATLLQWSNELERLNYGNGKASAAYVWCVQGTWFFGKTELTFPDLFPTPEMLRPLDAQLVSKSYHINRCKALREDYEKQLANLKFNNTDCDDLKEDFATLGRELLALHETNVSLREENAKLRKMVLQMDAKFNRLSPDTKPQAVQQDSDSLQLDCNTVEIP